MQNEYNAVEIKDRLREKFEEKNEIAYKVLPTLGMSKNTLDKTNTSMLSADKLAILADHLGETTDYFLGRKDKKTSPVTSTEDALWKRLSQYTKEELHELYLYLDFLEYKRGLKSE